MTRKTEAKPSTSSAATPTDWEREQNDAYLEELDALLERVEAAVTHYDALGLDSLSTNGEVKLAYMRSVAILNPATYDLRVSQPLELLPRVDSAFARVSTAFSVLVNFDRRMAYDDELFGRPVEDPVADYQPAVITIGEDVEILNRRSFQRFELSIPVLVSGYDAGFNEWSESTHSVDVSRKGALLRLRKRLRPGAIVYLRMPLPLKLRDHGYLNSSYGVYAIVRRVGAHDGGFRHFGLEFLGDGPPQGFLDSPWSVFNTNTWTGVERRARPRRTKSRKLEIEYFDESMQFVKSEAAVTEDLSDGGCRLRVAEPPHDFELVRLYSPDDGFEKFAVAVNQYDGDDGKERLCLQFIER